MSMSANVVKITAARVRFLVFAWFAVTVLILSTACTKGGGGQSLPAPTPVPPPAKSGIDPTKKDSRVQPLQTRKRSSRGAGGELDRDSSKNSQEDSRGDSQEEYPQEDPQDDSQSAPPAEGPAQAPSTGALNDGEVLMNPIGMKPEEIFDASAKLGSASVGPQADVNSAEPLYFSGAGQDLLHEQLSALINSEKDESKAARDQELAMQVGLSTFMVNADTRQAIATVTLLDSKGAKKQIQFKGVLDNQSRLRGGDLKTQGLAFEAVCMDESGGCHTVQMRVRKAVRDGVATAHVIARHSLAYIYSDGADPAMSTNPEYAKLMGILVNTASSPSRPETVRALSFWTSEAINGRSEFAVQMMLGADSRRPQVEQAFSITGPLVKPASATDMNLVVARPLGLVSVKGKTVVARGNLMDAVREMRLVKNDGRGNLQVDIDVRKGSARAQEETIHLTIARIHEAVRQPILR